MEAFFLLFGAISVVLCWTVTECVSADHKLCSIIIEVAQTVLTEVDQVIPVLLILAELEGHVHNESAGEYPKNDGPEIHHVITNLEGVHGQEAVTGIIAVNKVVGEQPEFETKVVKNTPNNKT